MRHLKRNAKLGRVSKHRNAMLANLVCSLIKHRRITTTLAKAKAARSVAEKLVTLGKKGSLHDRRIAASRLRQHAQTLHDSKARRESWRQNEDVVRILFEDLAPVFKDRAGGYTRILRLAERRGDSAQLAILEWVDSEAATVVETVTETTEAEPKAKKKAKAKTADADTGAEANVGTPKKKATKAKASGAAETKVKGAGDSGDEKKA